ncbi:hypothetical protein O181_093603 [Austropuccinia psidii MF-1]|uniref:Uncharacterized protein n=1 Tax=Austropuccinia psidii MF-1 TaxID=1389203 RepID=A0A9Q3J1J4_9BASI|nr:hypothetical protein [Austropuccinia psidii MF-1]
MSALLVLFQCESCIANIFTDTNGNETHGKLITQKSKQRHNQRCQSAFQLFPHCTHRSSLRNHLTHDLGTNTEEDIESDHTSSLMHTSRGSQTEADSAPFLCKHGCHFHCMVEFLLQLEPGKMLDGQEPFASDPQTPTETENESISFTLGPMYSDQNGSTNL